MASDKQNDSVFHFKGAQRGRFDEGRWWVNFFSIYRPSVAKLTQNGILMGFLYKKYGKDYFNIRIESGDRKDEGIQSKDLCKEIKLNWRRRIGSDTRVGF